MDSTIFDYDDFVEWLNSKALGDVVGACGWNSQSPIISYFIARERFDEHAILPGGISYIADGKTYTEEFPRWVELFLKQTAVRVPMTRQIVVYPFMTARECKKQLALAVKGLMDATNSQEAGKEEIPTPA